MLRRKNDSQDKGFLCETISSCGLAGVVGLVGGLSHMFILAMLHGRPGIEIGSQIARGLCPSAIPSQRQSGGEKVVRRGLRTTLSAAFGVSNVAYVPTQNPLQHRIWKQFRFTIAVLSYRPDAASGAPRSTPGSTPEGRKGDKKDSEGALHISLRVPKY